MPNRVLAIMITDMKGFTAATSAMTRAEVEELHQLHRSLILPLVTARGGRLLKTLGDGFLIYFESPTDGLQCGLDLQQRLAAHNASLAQDDRVEVRVALALGEVHDTGTDVEGEAVNLAARLVARTLPGQVLFTDCLRMASKRAEFARRELGFMEFKGVDELIKVFELLHEKSEEVDWPGQQLVESLAEEILEGNWRKSAVRIDRLAAPYLSSVADAASPDEQVQSSLARLEKVERFLLRLAERAVRYKITDALSSDGGILSHLVNLYESVSERQLYDSLLQRHEKARQSSAEGAPGLDPAGFLDGIFQRAYLLGMYCTGQRAFAAVQQVLESSTTDRTGRRAPLVDHPRCTGSKDGVLSRMIAFGEEENVQLALFRSTDEVASLLTKFNLLACAWCEQSGLEHPSHFMVDPELFQKAVGDFTEDLEALEAMFKGKWKETVVKMVRRNPFQDFYLPKLTSAWGEIKKK